jgi:hypothetical protein
MKNFIKKAIRIFSKNGGEGASTKIFQDLDILSRERFLNEIKIGLGETPIIVSDFNQTLFMLTDERLIQKHNDVVKNVLLSEVRSVNFNNKDFASKKKETWNELYVTLYNNESITLMIESGLPFFGVWNILLFVESHYGKIK